MTRPLFSKAGIERLKTLVQESCLIGFDFDGTLVSIVSDPKKVVVKKQVLNLLKQLSLKKSVAIISGRKRSDVIKFIPIKKIQVLGNHGIEGSKINLKTKNNIFNQVAKWNEKLKPQVLKYSGVNIENKKYSLSIHYRHAINRSKTRAQLLEIIKKLEIRARVIDGIFVLNLLPLKSGNKGEALKKLIKKSVCTTSLYIGDDITDEDAFKLSSNRVLTVRVGVSKKTKAQFHLKQQSEILKLLKTLNHMV
ncbi:MAG: trehalose-phosphatase [Oligoflexia bacterium]|nr:trehalose-phosphatase [Oligoflexia bacterium]